MHQLDLTNGNADMDFLWSFEDLIFKEEKCCNGWYPEQSNGIKCYSREVVASKKFCTLYFLLNLTLSFLFFTNFHRGQDTLPLLFQLDPSPLEPEYAAFDGAENYFGTSRIKDFAWASSYVGNLSVHMIFQYCQCHGLLGFLVSIPLSSNSQMV